MVAVGGKGCPYGPHINANDSNEIPACAGCGRCCHQVVSLIEGVDAVPDEWVVEHDGVRCLEQRGDGACVALDPVTQLCTIYESRPKVCRDFARGGELCRRILAQPSRRTKATLKGWRVPSGEVEVPLPTSVQP